MESLDAIRAFLFRTLRGQLAPDKSSKRTGEFTKPKSLDAHKRKHLRDIQKMSRVKNRAA
jgi:hypothetical protein